MVKTPLPMQSEDEGYIAMANTLRRDPRQLRSMLLARRKDLTLLLKDTAKRKDAENEAKLTAALGEIDDALARLILPKPKGGANAAAKLMAAPESLEGEDSDEEEADDTDGDDLNKTNDEEEDADEVSADAEDGTDDSGGEADVEEDVDAPEVDDAADEGDEPAEEAAPTEPENPVAMNTRLRKEVGDSAADFLDDYGQAIHKKVMSFFESLMTKALDLGEEDDSDGKSSLREILKEEVGKRGIRKIEPVFGEWRGVVVKQIAKDVAEMFKPPEPEPEALPEAEEVSPEAAPAATENAAPEASEEVPAATVASAVAANNAPLPLRATGRVSFAVKGAAVKATDFKPSGFTAPRLD